MKDEKKPYVHPISPALRAVMDTMSDEANEVLIHILNEVGGYIVEQRTLKDDKPSEAEDAPQHSPEVNR